jgi:hypothetical protein
MNQILMSGAKRLEHALGHWSGIRRRAGQGQP